MGGSMSQNKKPMQPTLFDMEGLWIEDSPRAQMERELGIKPEAKLVEIDRERTFIRSIYIEELIEPEHKARAIWEFIEKIDFNKYYDQILSRAGEKGRPAIDPKVLFALLVYAYSKGVGSSREISYLCQHDPAYQWITGGVEISHATIAAFRSTKAEAIRGWYIQVLGVLSHAGLIDLKKVTTDGTKIRANASRKSFKKRAKLKEHLVAARKWVREMEQAAEDEPESDTVIGQRLSDRRHSARLRAAKERASRIEDALEKLERLDKEEAGDKNEKRVSETDPDAEYMKHGNGGGCMPSYNLQLGTDASNGVIVAVEITEEKGDSEQLIGISKQVEENLGSLPEKVLADGAYITRSNIIETSNMGVDLYGPNGNGIIPTETNMKTKGIDMAFSPDQFEYDREKNVMICPAGNSLRYNGKEPEIGAIRFRYRASARDCQICPHKMLCCPKTKSGRSVSRYEEDPLITGFKKKMETDEAKEIYKCRSQVAEFSNACIKKKYRLTQFLTRGCKKVICEALIACVAQNIQIWKRIKWRPELIGQVT